MFWESNDGKSNQKIRLMIVAKCDRSDWTRWLSVSKRLRTYIQQHLFKSTFAFANEKPLLMYFPFLVGKRMFYAHVHAEPFSHEGHHIGIFSTLLDAQTFIRDHVHPNFRTDIRPVWCSFNAEATSTDTDGETKLITMYANFRFAITVANF